MKVLLTIVVALSITGCASYRNRSNGLTRDQMNEANNFASMNNVIWGTYGLKTEKYDKFSKTDYEEILSKDPSDTAEHAQKFYVSLNAKEIYSYEDGYIICGFSKQHSLGFCDDAACRSTEVILDTNTQPQFSDLKSKIVSPGVCNAQKK